MINFWLTGMIFVPSVFSSLHLPDSCYTYLKSHLFNVSTWLPRVFSGNQEKSLIEYSHGGKPLLIGLFGLLNNEEMMLPS